MGVAVNITLDIQDLTARQDADGDVILWRVAGTAGLFPTKMCAEAVAARVFPQEEYHSRYQRIFYTRFVADA